MATWTSYALGPAILPQAAFSVVQCDDLDELRDQADAGNEWAALRLALLLASHGDLDEAIQILRDPANAGNFSAAWLLARV